MDDAGILVNNPVELRDAMSKLLTDEAARNRLIAAGKARAPQFTWTKAAQSLLKVIKGQWEKLDRQRAARHRDSALDG